MFVEYTTDNGLYARIWFNEMLQGAPHSTQAIRVEDASREVEFINDEGEEDFRLEPIDDLEPTDDMLRVARQAYWDYRS